MSCWLATSAIGVTEDFLGMRAREGVARDFLSALDAFKEEGIARALGDSQIGADGSQQIRGKNIVDRDEVALFREALKFAEVRLDHGSEFTGGCFQFSVHSQKKPIITSLEAIERGTSLRLAGRRARRGA